MADSMETSAESPIQRSLKSDNIGSAPYAAPEFKTISAAARPKNRGKKRAPKQMAANETKPFSIDDLFMTDS